MGLEKLDWSIVAMMVGNTQNAKLFWRYLLFHQTFFFLSIKNIFYISLSIYRETIKLYIVFPVKVPKTKQMRKKPLLFSVETDHFGIH